MNESSYSVTFSGEVQTGKEPSEVKANLARVLKLDEARAARLFSGRSIVVKRNIDEDGARRFKAVFERCGAVCTVTPSLAERRIKTREASIAPPDAIKIPPADIEKSDEAPDQARGFGYLTAALIVIGVGAAALFLFLNNADSPAPRSERVKQDAIPSLPVAKADITPVIENAREPFDLAEHEASATSGMALELFASHKPTDHIEAARNTIVFIESDIGRGAGFFMNDDCLVVTNRHLVEAPDGSSTGTAENEIDTPVQISVSIINGRQMPAFLVATSENRDLAYLAVEAENCPTLPSNENPGVRVGTGVLIFSRSGDADYVSNRFVISGYQTSAERDLIQLEEVYEPGNFSGPLIDLDGRLVGIVTRGVQTVEDFGFAIPAHELLADYEFAREQIEVNLP